MIIEQSNDIGPVMHYAHLLMSREDAERALRRGEAEDVQAGGVYDVRGTTINVWSRPWLPGPWMPLRQPCSFLEMPADGVDEMGGAARIGAIHIALDQPEPGRAVVYAIEVDEGYTRADVEHHIGRIFSEAPERAEAEKSMDSERVYIGVRDEGATETISRVEVREPDGSRRPLRHVAYHSDGLEWGYGGAGPADLALSILADVLGERPSRRELDRGTPRCWQLHQQFKWDVIAGLHRGSWTLPASAVRAWIVRHDSNDSSSESGTQQERCANGDHDWVRDGGDSGTYMGYICRHCGASKIEAAE